VLARDVLARDALIVVVAVQAARREPRAVVVNPDRVKAAPCCTGVHQPVSRETRGINPHTSRVATEKTPRVGRWRHM